MGNTLTDKDRNYDLKGVALEPRVVACVEVLPTQEAEVGGPLELSLGQPETLSREILLQEINKQGLGI